MHPDNENGEDVLTPEEIKDKENHFFISLRQILALSLAHSVRLKYLIKQHEAVPSTLLWDEILALKHEVSNCQRYVEESIQTLESLINFKNKQIEEAFDNQMEGDSQMEEE